MRYFLLVIATLLLACSSMKVYHSENTGNNTEYKDIAQSILGDSLKFALNSDSSMVLCQNIRRTEEPPHIQQVDFCVINIANNEVLYRSKMANGSVAWFGKVQLKIRNFKGFPTVNNEGVFIYDIEKQKRMKYQDQLRDKE